MPLTVRSPHDGHPVKVRPEDVGRALRDSRGRVFYVVPRARGEGYYGSATRSGNSRDEERARAWEANPPAPPAEGTSVAHDATGKRRPEHVRGKLVIAFLVLLVAFLVWLFGFGPLANRWTPSPAPPLEEKLREQSGRTPIESRSIAGQSGQSGQSGHSWWAVPTLRLPQGATIHALAHRHHHL